jgi:DNA-binding HxlR family transcriptional regulator
LQRVSSPINELTCRETSLNSCYALRSTVLDNFYPNCYTVNMNKYGQYCPMARAVEILGDRWTLLIVRDIVCGTQNFNALERGLPGIPKSLLTNRLKRLQQAGILERQQEPGSRKTSYHLTPAGWELYPILQMLTQWGASWAFGEPEKSELNPVLLLWWMHDRVHRERLPQQRVVIEFDFHETRPNRYWIVLKPEDVSVCIKHPGYEIDLLVQANLAVFYKVWLGKISFGEAIREGGIELDGQHALTRGFPTWFALSPTAEIVRGTAAAALKPFPPIK